MKIFKCRECNKYFHKSMHHSKCIYCGCDDVESMQNVESSNKEALRHYKKGCKYLTENRYTIAKEEFFFATRFDLEYSEAYWMGYLAEIGVCSDDELIYSGKLNDNSSEIMNAIKYANFITKEVYQEVIRVNSLLTKELIQLNEVKCEQKIHAELDKNNCKEVLQNIQKDYTEIGKYKHLIMESKHKLLNLKWEIQQKYANMEYTQLMFCNDVIERYIQKGYASVAKSTEGIIAISAVQKYQDLISIKEVEEKCKSCSEYRDVLKEITVQRDLNNKIKEHYDALKKHKETLLGYIRNMELIEKLSRERDSYEELYRGVDIRQPLMVNYNKIKLGDKS